eukprot:6385990-Prymnesium_polylepis.1
MAGVLARIAARRADMWMAIMDDGMAQSTTSIRALVCMELRMCRDRQLTDAWYRVYHSSYNLTRDGHIEKVEAIIDKYGALAAAKCRSIRTLNLRFTAACWYSSTIRGRSLRMLHAGSLGWWIKVMLSGQT